MISVTDVVIDSLYEELIQAALKPLGGRLVMDPEEPEEPFLTPDGYLVVRIKNQDPVQFSRELERRVSNMRLVGTYDRTPREE